MVQLATREVTVGLRARTARAIAVALAGTREAPVAVRRTELSFLSPTSPATFQPYHAVLDLPWPEAKVAVREAAAAIEELATAALGALVGEIRARAYSVRGLGIVGAPERNLEAIGNPHIRAHAAEGVLFRQVLEVAARANGLSARSFPERDLARLAVTELGLANGRLDARLAELGRAVGRPWRADEKAAATAAWLVLAR